MVSYQLSNRDRTLKLAAKKGRPGTRNVNFHILQVLDMTDTCVNGHAGVTQCSDSCC